MKFSNEYAKLIELGIGFGEYKKETYMVDFLLRSRERLLDRMVALSIADEEILNKNGLSDKLMISELKKQITILGDAYKYDGFSSIDEEHKLKIEKLKDRYLELMEEYKEEGINDVFIEFTSHYYGSSTSFDKVIEDLKNDGVRIDVVYTKEHNNQEEIIDKEYVIALNLTDYLKFLNKYNEINKEAECSPLLGKIIGNKNIYFVPPMIEKRFNIEEIRDLIEIQKKKDGFFRYNNFGLGSVKMSGAYNEKTAIHGYISRGFSEMFDEGLWPGTPVLENFTSCSLKYTQGKFKGECVNPKKQLELYKEKNTPKEKP